MVKDSFNSVWKSIPLRLFYRKGDKWKFGETTDLKTLDSRSAILLVKLKYWLVDKVWPLIIRCGRENAITFRVFWCGTMKCREVRKYFSTISFHRLALYHLVTCSLRREIIYRPTFYSHFISGKLFLKELIRDKNSSKIGKPKERKIIEDEWF